MTASLDTLAVLAHAASPEPRHEIESEPTPPPERTRRRSLRSWVAVAAVVLIAAAVVRRPASPLANDLGARMLGPSVDHPFGTDHLGRDVLARVAHGAVLSVGLAAAALVASAVMGGMVGFITGWSRRRGATVALCIADAWAAVPTVVIALVVTAVTGPGTTAVLIAVVAAGWASYARLTHQLTQKVTHAPFIEAASLLGAGATYQLRHHVWPNVARPVMAHALLGLPGALLTVAGLSYLGLGAQPPAPEWGAMLAEAQPYLERAPLAVVAPALAIVAAGWVAAASGRSLESRSGPFTSGAARTRRCLRPFAHPPSPSPEGTPS